MGADIALDGAGGTIESISGYSERGFGTGFNSRRLIDAAADPVWEGDRDLYLWPRAPLDIALSFYRHEPALVTAVAIVPPAEERNAPKDIEVWTSMQSANEGFARVAALFVLISVVNHRLRADDAELRSVIGDSIVGWFGRCRTTG